ncbi:hypothetical protein WME76_29260 [Sorangium sp. So ce119]|uniref:hypothetical protein n=1 Tax=Sorangium sp. So ce119 TaxID=3133279 RepID=UPI003F627D65
MGFLHLQRLRKGGSIAVITFMAIGCGSGPAPTHVESDTVPSHVLWARELVDNIEPEHNEYGRNPSFVRWAGVEGSLDYRNRSVCGTFLTHVLRQAFNLSDADVTAWFGSASPNAAAYHDAIATERRFEKIQDVNSVRAGDIIAIRYPDGGEDSGHVGLIVDFPVPRAAAPPAVSGTSQYELAIVDSSKSGHGATDTRLNPDGSWHPGAGVGVMRLYADERGRPVGYTWSTLAASEYFSQSERSLLVGRLR